MLSNTMAFTVNLCLTCLFFLNACECFLLNSTSVGGKPDDNYYRILVENMADEKRQLLQVQQQQKQMATLLNGLQHDLNACQTKHSTLRDHVYQMEKENLELRLNNSRLEKRVGDTSAEINILRRDLNALNHSVTDSEIQNVTSLQQNIKSINGQLSIFNLKLSSCTSNANSRSHDFLVLQNQTNRVQKELTNLDSKTTELGIHLYSKITDVESQVSKKTHELSVQMSNEIQSVKQNVSMEVKEVSEKIKELSKKVILSSCALHDLTYSAGQVILFPSTRTSLGISNLGDFQITGKFKCVEQGTYLISVFIMSNSTNSEYEIYKNNVILSRVYISGKSKDIYDYHTGSATLAVDLSFGDTFYVKPYRNMFVFHTYSCITIIKIQ